MADDAVLVDTNVLLTATTPARALHREVNRILTMNVSDFRRFAANAEVWDLATAEPFS